MTGANSKENDLRRTFGIPSGPGDFLTLIELSAPCTFRTVENRSSGMTSTLIRDTSAEVSGETNEKVVNFFTQGTQSPHVILRGDTRDIFHLFPPSAIISALQRFNFPFMELTFTCVEHKPLLVGYRPFYSTSLHREVFSRYSGFPSPQKPIFDLICIHC